MLNVVRVGKPGKMLSVKSKVAVGLITFIVLIGVLVIFYLHYNFRTEIFVAVAGILGVMLTLYGNALLSIHQQQRQWLNDNKRQAEEREHDRTVLRIGLIEELNEIRAVRTEAFKTTQRALEKEENTSILVTSDLDDTVYRSSISDIGCLTQEEVKEVVATYSRVRRQSKKLCLLGLPDEQWSDYIRVPPENIHVVHDIEKGVISLLDNAVKALNTNLTKTYKNVE